MSLITHRLRPANRAVRMVLAALAVAAAMAVQDPSQHWHIP